MAVTCLQNAYRRVGRVRTIRLVVVFAAIWWLVPTCFAIEALAVEASATRIDLEPDGDATVVVISLSRPAIYRVVTLPDPYRIVIDLSHVEFRLPPADRTTSLGIVKAFRYGRFAAGKSRIVIDTDGPARVLRSSSAQTAGGAQVRVSLAATTGYAFGKVYRKRKRREAIQQQDAAQWEAVTRPARARKDGKKVIVIDPGHGGVDSGATVEARTREKDIVLAFSHDLRKALERTGRYVVRMTRRGDIFVPLRARVEFARRHGADLFISIHADSVASEADAGISGTTVYTLSEDGSDAAAREFAARENTSDVIAGVDLPEQSNAVTNILVDLAQRETNSRSEDFARVVLAHIRKATKLSRGPHRSAAFRVLKAPDVPSLLIELGYLSNHADETRLRSPKWRADVARSLTRSVKRYFAGQTSEQPY